MQFYSVLLHVNDVCSRYTVNSVLASVGVTAAITLCLTLFALQTKVCHSLRHEANKDYYKKYASIAL